jgi:hypothetical protein
MMAETMCIAIARGDGGVSIMKILRADGDSPTAIAEEVAKWQSTSDVRAVGHWPIKESDIPTDRTFRNAWTRGGEGQWAIDMQKATIIQRGRIRRARDAELAALDIPFMRAVEAGDDGEQAAIAAAKQRLRDLPRTVDLSKAQTPDELKAIWPEDLPRR